MTMANTQPVPAFEHDLGNNGGRVCFASIEHFHEWIQKEFVTWQWLTSGRPATDRMWNTFEHFRNRVQSLGEEWRRYSNNPDHMRHIFQQLGSALDQYYREKLILHSTAPAAEFVLKIKAEYGDAVAAGAYAAQVRGGINFSSVIPAEFFLGVVHGFLYLREIDWTASAHQDALGRLRSRYDEHIALQDKRAQELEARNATLNSAFEATLKSKESGLDKLHDDQVANFNKLIEDHIAKLTAIEKTYDQKLALQKPVKYWQTKENYHSSRAKNFSIAAVISGVFLAVGMGFLSYWALESWALTKTLSIGTLVFWSWRHSFPFG